MTQGQPTPAAKPSVAIIGTRGYPSYYGGFETAVRRLAPHLADLGWDVTVYGRAGALWSDDPGRDERVRSVITRGVETKSLSTLSYGFFSALHALREKPDVALVMNVANGFVLPLLALRGIPTLVNVDGIEWERAKWGRAARAVFKLGARMTARWGTRLVFDSGHIAQRWRTDFGRDGDFIPYGGDPLDEHLPVEPGLSHRGYVLLVARFVPENTVGEFFRAVPAIARDHPVVIVGSSGYGGELEEQARSLVARFPRVRWLGHVSDDRRLGSLWQHAGVYFHGHSVGGTNPALVQAMAAGAPTLARDTPYNREVLGEAGVFTPATAEDIAQRATTLLADRDRLNTLSDAGRARAAALYSWPTVCAQYEQALTQLRNPHDARVEKA